jgi:hypothetical protein
MRYTGNTTIKFEVGFMCARPCAGESYKIISCIEIKEPDEIPAFELTKCEEFYQDDYLLMEDIHHFEKD